MKYFILTKISAMKISMTSTSLYMTMMMMMLMGSLVVVGASDNVYRMNQRGDADDVKQGNDDIGTLNSCLEPPPEKFKFQWSPRIIRTGKTLVASFDFKFPQDFRTANICVTVWLKGIEEPIYYDCGNTDCDKLRNFMVKMFPDLPKCPVPADYNFKKTFPYKVDPNVPLPAGEYGLQLDIHQGQTQMLCMKGDVSIEDE